MAAQGFGFEYNAHVQQRGSPVLGVFVDRHARQLKVTGG